jgi:hypothetical protein
MTWHQFVTNFHDAELQEALASELRTDPSIKSVEWTETGSEA